MERDRLARRLVPLILLVATGAASAVEVLPEQRAAAVGAQGQKASVQRLQAMAGQQPTASAAKAELTDADRERIAADNKSAPSGKPLKVGVVKSIEVGVDLQPLDVSAMTDQTYSFGGGYVRNAGDSLTWVTRLDAVGTVASRLRFDNVTLPLGAKLWIYNDAGDVKGPYAGNADSFWTHTITGEQVFVQVEVADDASDDVSFTIGAIMLFDDSSAGFCPVNAPCVEDGTCHTSAEWPAIDQVRKAIAHMNFIADGWSYVCSGGLLADTDAESSIPYFLSADHCISDPDDAATLETWFNYKTPTCNGGCLPIKPGTASTLGATLLHHSAIDDHSLMVLEEMPPDGAWHLGWSDTPVAGADGTVLFRLSHPSGSPQAFSAHRVDRGVSPADFCGTTTIPRGPFIFTRDIVGATEGGSSGSPLIQADGKVVGQLFGACGFNVDDVCDVDSNVTVDGAFANYYPDVAQWLNPDAEALPLVVQKFGTGEGQVLSSLQDGSSTEEAAQSGSVAQPRLAGGVAVEQMDWPWQAAIKVSVWGLDDWTCGGTVIHPNWILTAAHCVIDSSTSRFLTISPSNIQVRTGSTRFEYGGQASDIKRIVKHPEFDPATREHDIALLELRGPVYVDPLRPVTWEREPTLACPGIAGSVTGWTSTELCGQPAVMLSSVAASIVEPDVCRSTYGSDVITDAMLCTSSAAADTENCQADDGSPLVVDNGRGGYTQAGVVSYGNDCDTPEAPTVYTRIAPHVEWMESVTGEDLSSDVGPGVIDCGSTCSAQFAKDTVVTLTAEALPGSVFKGWDGVCTGVEDVCEVTMTQATTVKAIFSATQLSTQRCSP